MSSTYTVNTRMNGDGSEPCYVVWFRKEIIATFPVLDATTPDAREYAELFAKMMNEYILAERLRK